MKFSLLIPALLISSFCGWAQNNKDGILFKSQMNPETVYSQVQETNSRVSLKYSGSAKVKQELKKKGVKNPVVTNKDSKTETLIKTGKAENGKRFNLTLEYIKTSGGSEDREIPDGTKIYGHCNTGELPIYDSVVSENLSKQFKRNFLENLQNLSGQFHLEERKVKIGESFIVESPFNIPVQGSSIDMQIISRYTLEKVQGGKAFFNITQTYTLKSGALGPYLTAGGKARGKLVYDIANNYTSVYSMILDLKMKMKIKGMKMKLKSRTTTAFNTTITKA